MARLEIGLRQRDLAERVGCSRQFIGHVERGETVPALPMALKIATALGRSTEEVFYDLRNRALVEVYGTVGRARRSS